MKPISLPSPSGMTTYANLQPHESTSKAIFNPIQRQLASIGNVEPCEHNAAKFHLLWNHSLSSTSGMTSIANFQPNESTSKAIFSPTKVFQRQLASMGKLEPCEHNVAKIQPSLWDYF